MPQIRINGLQRDVAADPQMPLLWVIRDVLGMPGTKFGCGIGACGVCTVHMDGNAVRSCITTLADAVGHEIVTIEGLSTDGAHPVQRAWPARSSASNASSAVAVRCCSDRTCSGASSSTWRPRTRWPSSA